MSESELPRFPYHRDPLASGVLRASETPCTCCGRSRGVLECRKCHRRQVFEDFD